MDERALRAVPWTILAYAANRLVTLITTVVLARLLVPADFGIIVLATLIIMGCTHAAGLGLSGAATQRALYEGTDRSTLLTTVTLTGALAALLVAALSEPIAALLDEPRLAGVVRALAPLILLEELSSWCAVPLQRAFAFRATFICEVMRGLAYAAIAIALAGTGAGIWSLVVGMLAGSVVYFAAIARRTPSTFSWGFDRAVFGELWRSGKGFLAQRLTTFFQGNVDYLAVGAMLDPTRLGFYSMAYRVGEMPSNAIADSVAQVAFPGFAQMQARTEPIARPFLTTLRLVSLLAVPLGLLLSATAEPLTLAVFGEQWQPMAGVLMVLGLWAAIRPVEATLGWLLNATGHAARVGQLYVISLVLSVPALLVSAQLGGIVAVAWVVVGTMACMLAVSVVLADRHAGISWRSQWTGLRAIVLAGALLWVVARTVAVTFSGTGAAITAVVAVAAGAVTYLAALWALDRSLLDQAVTTLRRALRRLPDDPAVGAPSPARQDEGE